MNAAEIDALPVGTHLVEADLSDDLAHWVRMTDGWHLIDQWGTFEGRDWSNEGRSAEYLLMDDDVFVVVTP